MSKQPNRRAEGDRREKHSVAKLRGEGSDVHYTIDMVAINHPCDSPRRVHPWWQIPAQSRQCKSKQGVVVSSSIASGKRASER